MPINWCTSCKIGPPTRRSSGACASGAGSGPAGQEPVDAEITAYAQRLIDDLKDVDYIERVKTQQINSIGEGGGGGLRHRGYR